MADLVTRTVRGVELMRVGTWQGHGCPTDGCKFTVDDIEAMVEAYKAAGDTFNAPVKLGHDDNQKLLQKDGYPAAGWVINLRRQGDALVGDLEKVPAKIADLMKAGAYRKRSSEIRPDAEVNGKKFKWLFTGLALLGADLPAVEGLNDILGLYHSLQLSADDKDLVIFSENRDGETLKFGDDDEAEAIIADLDRLVERADRLISGRRGAPRLRSLVSTVKEELRRVYGSGKRMSREDVNEMDGKKLRELLGLAEDATDEEVETKLKQAKFSDPEKPAENESLSAEDKKELSELRGEVIKLRQERTADTAASLVDTAIKDGKILPAQRDQSLKFAVADPEGFKTFVASQPKVIELGERGSGGGETNNNVDLAELEPSASEREIARQLGQVTDDTWRINLMKSKADAKGITLPVNFGEKKEETKA